MNLSARSIYACLAAIELAHQYEAAQPVQIRVISDRHDIPSRFLVQILLQLKSAGMVTSTRGAAGGYQLARPPAQVSLWEIIEAVETHNESVTASGDSSPERTILNGIWNRACDSYQNILKDSTLDQIVEQLGDGSDPMYFI